MASTMATTVATTMAKTMPRTTPKTIPKTIKTREVANESRASKLLKIFEKRRLVCTIFNMTGLVSNLNSNMNTVGLISSCFSIEDL